jgi:hypothetical protein
VTGRLFQAPGDAFLGGDKALEWLEKAYDERDRQDITNLKVRLFVQESPRRSQICRSVATIGLDD